MWNNQRVMPESEQSDAAARVYRSSRIIGIVVASTVFVITMLAIDDGAIDESTGTIAVILGILLGYAVALAIRAYRIRGPKSESQLLGLFVVIGFLVLFPLLIYLVLAIAWGLFG